MIVNRTLRFGFFAATCALMFSLAASAAQAADKLKIGETGSGSVISWPIYIANKKGIFDKLGLQVEMIAAPSSAAVMQQLTAGEMNIGISSPFDALRAIDKGAPLSMIRVEMQAPPYEVYAKPSINGLADLKGKIVMLGGAKDITRYYVERMLEPYGVKSGDFDMIYAGATSQRFAALLSGSIDATILATPYNFRAKTAGFKNLGAPVSADNNIPFAVFSVNSKWGRDNHELLTRFLDGFAKGVDYFHNPANRADTIEIFREVSRSSPEDVALTYEFANRLPTFDRAGAFERGGIGMVLKELQKSGDLDGPPDLARFVDPSLAVIK
jgi:ABC-type nitrate/sulfonate/bicarbonate transport system substrate-binding protein